MTQTLNTDADEVVVVAFEADLTNFFQQQDEAYRQTVQKWSNLPKQQAEPFKWDKYDKVLQDNAKRFEEAFKPPAQALQGWDKIKGSIQGLTGQFQGATGYAKELTAAGENAVGTIMQFARGRGSIQAVTGAVKGLTGALGVAGGVATIALGGIALVVKGVIDKVNEATASLKQMVDARTLETFGVQTNVLFEGFETQFKTLLGSVEAARERIAEYAEFGATTPFNLPEIVQAGKLLQTFGGDALATGNNLRMVGDAASAAGVGFSTVAMWVGRAYSAMQSGRPFGEAAARLQELGLMSGEERNRLEELQKSGASAEEQFAAFTEVMGKFTGMMDQQSQTLAGMRSNLEDYQEQIALVGGEPIFDEEKRSLQEYLNFLERGTPFEEAQGRIEDLKQALEDDDIAAFDKSTKRLQELGFITEETRLQMDQLRRTGAEADDILGQVDTSQFEQASEAIEQFRQSLKSGDIEPFEQSITNMAELGVITDETAARLNELKAEGATADELLNASGLETNKDLIGGIAQAIGMAKASVLEFANTWKEALLDNLPLDAIRDLMQNIAEIVDQFLIMREVITGVDLATQIGGWTEQFVGFLNWLTEAVITFNEIIIAASAFGRGLVAMFDVIEAGYYMMLGRIANAPSIWEIISGEADLSDFNIFEGLENVPTAAMQAMNNEIDNAVTLMAQAEERRNQYINGIRSEEEATKELTGAIEDQGDALDLMGQTLDYVDEFMDIQREAAEETERINKEHQESLTEIQADGQEDRLEAEEDFNDKIADINEKRDEKLSDLDKDTAKKRQKIIDDTNKKIAEADDDARREEAEAEAEHQRNMDEMRRRFEDNLTEAVRARDAVRIRELRESYEEEKRTTEDDFRDKQDKKREDRSRERQEAEQDQQERLAELDAEAEERRTKIEEQTQKERDQAREKWEERKAQIDEIEQERIAKENENYELALQAQQEADDKRLQQIMESMAKDEEMTEEGARQILETLNETFGIGGDIDALMEDFIDRRSQKMKFTVEIEKRYKTTGNSSEGDGGTDRVYETSAQAYEAIYGGGRGRTATPGREFATGGLMLATQPTLVSVAESGPEIFSAAPVRALNSMNQVMTSGGGDNAQALNGRQELDVSFSGSAPPGFDAGHRDMIASVVLNILRDAGWLTRRR